MAKNILIVIIVCVFMYFSVNLFSMQFTQGGQYYLTAISNNFSKKIVLPQRGEIYDIDGNVLAENLLEYEVLLSDGLLSNKDFQEFILKVGRDDRFADNLKVDSSLDINQQKIIERRGYRGILILEDLSLEEYNDFFKQNGQLKGLVGIETPLRIYKYPFELAHVLGYLGISDISGVELEGKSGIEKFYDDVMSGKAGERFVYKSNDGNYSENLFRKPAKGDSLFLTINSKWQKLIYDLMVREMGRSGAYGAAAVIIKSDTGEVRSMVSLPSFDNNEFIEGISEEKFESLANDARKPLLNKAISINVSPGSTIKPFVALFALKDGVIDPTYEYESRGCEELGTGVTFCEADSRVLGNIGLVSSISRSSNLYYCSIARKYDDKFGGQGVQYLLDDFDHVDFLEKSGLDLPGEVVGTLPSPERIQKNQGRNWSYGDSCNMVIGQGDLSVSPIKLAMLASLIDNDGVVYQPFLLKKAVDQNGDTSMESFSVQRTAFSIEDKESFALLKRAMRRTIDDANGSAHMLRDIEMNLRIKTGSADAKEVLGDSRVIEGAHSWVMGSFLFEEEKYSFAMVQLYGGRGYQTLPVIGNFLNCISDDFNYPDCIKY